MENIKTTIIGFIILAIIVGIAYSIMFVTSVKFLLGIGFLVAGIIIVISLAFLALMVGEVFLKMWRKKERD